MGKKKSAVSEQDGSSTNASVTPEQLPRKSTKDTRAILSTTNPDIFVTSPRRGGFLKIVTPSRSQDFAITTTAPSMVKSDITASRMETDSNVTDQLLFKKSRMSTTSSFSRCCRYCPDESQATLKEHGYGGDPDMDMEFDETEEFNQIPDIMGEEQAAGMLAVTISTVMLMASQNRVSDEYLEWAESFLSCVKDENDQYPPNVKGILNHIKSLRRKDSLASGGGRSGGGGGAGGGGGPGACSCSL